MQQRSAAGVAKANRDAILNEVRRSGVISVDGLVRVTRMSQPTVLKHLAALEATGLVRRSGFGESTGGRPPALYAFAPDRELLLGIAVEIPRAHAAVVDLSGCVVATRAWQVDERKDPEEVLEGILRNARDLCERLPDGGRVVRCGVAFSGFVDTHEGLSLASPRLPNWRNVAVVEYLMEHLAVPVTLKHHIDALTLAELSQDSVGAWDQFLLLDVGYGVGVRAVQGGRPLRGMFGNAGLLGHTTVVPDGRACLCGNRGCLEEYVSARALARELTRHAPAGTAAATPDLDDLAELAGGLFVDSARGRAPARRLVEEFESFLAIGIANSVNLFDIPRVVVSGFVTHGGDEFRRRLARSVAARLQPTHANDVAIAFSSLSRSRAAAHGAGLYALRQRLPFADPLVVDPTAWIEREDERGGEAEGRTYAAAP